MSTPPVTPLMTACIEMVGHLGAKDWQLRYQDDQEPVVWMALARFTRKGKPAFQVATDFTPERAAFSLLERLMDGGQCQYCQRPTGVTDDFAGEMPGGPMVCWYRFDPELKKFRRGCEGDIPKGETRRCRECGKTQLEHLEQDQGHPFHPDKRIRP